MGDETRSGEPVRVDRMSDERVAEIERLSLGKDARGIRVFNYATATVAALAREVRELREAGRALVAKLDAVGPVLTDLFFMRQNHGAPPYDGPTYEKELRHLRELIDSPPPAPARER